MNDDASRLLHIMETDALRAAHVQRGKQLEYATVGYNVVEGVVAIAAGAIAGSVALIGFGVDSAIEVSSGVILLWRLHADADESRRERIERRALRLVGISFVLLAAWVAFDAISALVTREAPDESIPGIVLAAVSLLVMPLLVRAKRKVANAISSSALAADARQTEFCTYLSAIVLTGLILNAALGWWWADPIAGLVMVPIIANEGREALKGKSCECGH
jgi:divalent metal cation (Fe/Co/Zn/Cd) transporter